MYQKAIMLIVLWVFIFLQSSDASLFYLHRRLGETVYHNKQPSVSPSPSPLHSVNVPEISPPPEGFIAKEPCGTAGVTCRVPDLVTACFLPGPTGTVLVQNIAKIPLEVSVTIQPVNKTYEGIEVLKHEFKEVNTSTNVRGGSSIIVTVGDQKCVMSVSIPLLPGNLYKPSAYLLFATVVIIGGAIVWYKTGKMGRQPNGIPYQELEMGKPEPPSSNVQTDEGWNQVWDDDWDEEKAVK